MKAKSHFGANVFSALIGLAVWFLVYYLLYFAFTYCLEYKAFIKFVNPAAQHIAMRNSYKFVFFLSCILATVASAWMISKTAKCKGAVYPGIFVFSVVFLFLAADFVIVRIMGENKEFKKIIKDIFAFKLFDTEFNFVSARCNGGDVHIVSTAFRLLPLCLVYYYAVKGKLKKGDTADISDGENEISNQ